MEMTDEMLYDTRLVDRHVARGRLSKADLDKHLEGLKDLAEQAESVAIQITDVGVSTVRSKPTGEHE